jgi:signal transduction histidine kinase
MLNPAIILLLIISFVDIVLGVFILLKNPKETANRSFALLSLFIFIWITVSFFEDELGSVGARFWLLKADYASAIFTAFILLLFCIDVSKAEIGVHRVARRVIVGIPALFSMLIFFTGIVIHGYEIVNRIISPVFGWAYLPFVIIVGASLVLGVVTLGWRYGKSAPEDKAKFIYLFIGYSLASFIAFTTDVLLADYLKSSPHYGLYSRLGLFSSVLVILSSGYAIVKHRLLNLKVITADLVSLGILVFSLMQVLLSRDGIELLQNGIMFVILLVFIIILVRSVENEVKQKDELAVANEKLQELDKARAEFMSLSSHQIQTPLTAIKGYVSLILEDPKKELKTDTGDMLKKVLISSERIIQLIHDFLSLSRIESGKMEYTYAKCSTEDICREVIDTLAIKAKERNLYLTYEKPKQPLPDVMIDGPKVREVISNLVDNAIKYTLSGGVSVGLELRSRNESGKGDRIKVTVTDTGIGIPKSELPHLFKKFSRGEDKSRLTAAGTGLGLYVGKVMIENNGGKVWAESDGDGKGSRFVVEIPVKQSEELLKSGWGGSGTRSTS